MRWQQVFDVVEHTTYLAVIPQTLNSLLPEDVAGNRDDYCTVMTVRVRLAFRPLLHSVFASHSKSREFR